MSTTVSVRSVAVIERFRHRDRRRERAMGSGVSNLRIGTPCALCYFAQTPVIAAVRIGRGSACIDRSARCHAAAAARTSHTLIDTRSAAAASFATRLHLLEGIRSLIRAVPPSSSAAASNASAAVSPAGGSSGSSTGGGVTIDPSSPGRTRTSTDPRRELARDLVGRVSRACCRREPDRRVERCDEPKRRSGVVFTGRLGAERDISPDLLDVRLQIHGTIVAQVRCQANAKIVPEGAGGPSQRSHGGRGGGDISHTRPRRAQ